MRLVVFTFALVTSAVTLLPAWQFGPPARTPGSRLVTESTCAANLGTGVRTRRSFCDIITATTPAGSVRMVVPARTGEATVFFDLHNRFDLPGIDDGTSSGVTYARHEAVVRLVDGEGAVIGRAAVVREFRVMADLFDQLAGGGRPGGVKGVGPGPPEAVRLTIPPGIQTLGIVGERLRVRTAEGRDDTYDAPGRPVAILSNLRLEYRPAR